MAKVVLLTGASKGIGFEAARQLGRAGFIVLLGARDVAHGEEAAAKLRAEGSDVRSVNRPYTTQSPSDQCGWLLKRYC